jgi:hypothetical protein
MSLNFKDDLDSSDLAYLLDKYLVPASQHVKVKISKYLSGGRIYNVIRPMEGKCDFRCHRSAIIGFLVGLNLSKFPRQLLYVEINKYIYVWDESDESLILYRLGDRHEKSLPRSNSVTGSTSFTRTRRSTKKGKRTKRKTARQ